MTRTLLCALERSTAFLTPRALFSPTARTTNCPREIDRLALQVAALAQVGDLVDVDALAGRHLTGQIGPPRLGRGRSGSNPANRPVAAWHDRRRDGRAEKRLERDPAARPLAGRHRAEHGRLHGDRRAHRHVRPCQDRGGGSHRHGGQNFFPVRRVPLASGGWRGRAVLGQQGHGWRRSGPRRGRLGGNRRVHAFESGFRQLDALLLHQQRTEPRLGTEIQVGQVRLFAAVAADQRPARRDVQLRGRIEAEPARRALELVGP